MRATPSHSPQGGPGTGTGTWWSRDLPTTGVQDRDREPALTGGGAAWRFLFVKFVSPFVIFVIGIYMPEFFRNLSLTFVMNYL